MCFETADSLMQAAIRPSAGVHNLPMPHAKTKTNQRQPYKANAPQMDDVTSSTFHRVKFRLINAFLLLAIMFVFSLVYYVQYVYEIKGLDSAQFIISSASRDISWDGDMSISRDRDHIPILLLNRISRDSRRIPRDRAGSCGNAARIKNKAKQYKQ